MSGKDVDDRPHDMTQRPGPEPASGGGLDPKALALEDAAKMLGVKREWLEEDLEAGAPRNPDGTINLIHYAAWLNLQLAGEPDTAA